MKLRLWVLLAVWAGMGTNARSQPDDSVRVVGWLTEAMRLPADSCLTLFFARKLEGVPYKAGTLDASPREQLVARTDSLDCMTFVETVVALSRCARVKAHTFGAFKEQLRLVRYRHGVMGGYASRLHYVSDWIADNTRKGVLQERTRSFPFARQRVLSLGFMSAHAGRYPVLAHRPQVLRQLLAVEQRWKNYAMPYIPTSKVGDPSVLSAIREGDILVITTSIEGLDATHMGFAIRQGGVLKLLHASSRRGCVTLSRPLPSYLKEIRNTGIRVISLLP